MAEINEFSKKNLKTVFEDSAFKKSEFKYELSLKAREMPINKEGSDFGKLWEFFGIHWVLASHQKGKF